MIMDSRAYTWRPEQQATSITDRGPLAGLRLVVKDLFHIAGVPTGAGNPDWLATHSLPEVTAPLVQTLLEAGAVLVGKSSTDELAYSLNGQNIHYGSPLNPKAPDRLPGGSSTGSAVAVAAGEADIGLGTDTGGSIRVPASYNGLFGLRPSHGLLSLQHTVPLAPPFDTPGWMTPSAQTLARVGDCLLPQNLPAPSIQGPVKVAVLLPEQEGQSLWATEHQTWLASMSGQLLVERSIPVSGDWFSRASECFRVLQGRAIWRSHGSWITAHKPVFAPDIRARLQWSRRLTRKGEVDAGRERSKLCADIAGWFEGVDTVLMPTTPGPAPKLAASRDWMASYRSQLMGLTAPAGLGGLPQLHLPVLERDSAPMGISLLGEQKQDRRLLQWAEYLSGESSL